MDAVLSIKIGKVLLTFVSTKQTLDLMPNGVFFANSHGKQPCDGIGGTVKRLTAKASLQRPIKIKS